MDCYDLTTVPKVSICIPVLNQAAFLPERFATIDAQEFRDFEVVASDNFSDDGTWEWLQARAGSDPGLRLQRVARAGMYDNWNRCIEAARGDFVYVAPADDVMRPDCLRRLVSALEAHPSCGVADSQFHAVGPDGRELPVPELENREMRLLGPLWSRPHVRPALHDVPVITRLSLIHRSMTQVLVRRGVFASVGPFRTDLGSHADWEWHLRQSFTESKVFVPAPLSSWRRWHGQATKDDYLDTVDYSLKRLRMVDLACDAVARAGVRHPFTRWELRAEILREMAWQLLRRERAPARLVLLLAREPRIAVREVSRRLARRTVDADRVEGLRRVLGRRALRATATEEA